MSDKFVLTVELNARNNNASIKQAVSEIKRALSGIGGVNLNLNPNTQRYLNQTASNIRSVRKEMGELNKDVGSFDKQFANYIQRFGAYTVVVSGIFALRRELHSAINETLIFDRALVSLSQVTGASKTQLSTLNKEVSKLATTFGVSSKELIQASVTLAQAGLSADDTTKALATLAKTSLTPTFGSMADTAEGLIAVMNQFKLKIEDVDTAFGSINASSAKYAFESQDVIEAVKRAGATFSTAGGNINEFIGIFGAVRQTTRESADSIGNSLKTVFSRLQSAKTINLLESLGIKGLRDAQQQFVGPFKALETISEQLDQFRKSYAAAGLDFEKSPLFAQITTGLADVRNVSKVTPLLRDFATAKEIYYTSLAGGKSLYRDELLSQNALEVQFKRTAEALSEFLRAVSQDPKIRQFVKDVNDLTISMIKLATTFKDLIPYLAVIGIGKTVSTSLNVVKSLSSSPLKKASGGLIPGNGNKDDVPSLLMKGEYVVSKKGVQAVGTNVLDAINSGSVRKFADGGPVGDDSDPKKVIRNMSRYIISKVKENFSNIKNVSVSAESISGLGESQIKGDKRNNITGNIRINQELFKNVEGIKDASKVLYHELAHIIDYAKGSKGIPSSANNPVIANLSNITREVLEKSGLSNRKTTSGQSFGDYLSKPSEIFARSFEHINKPSEFIKATQSGKIDSNAFVENLIKGLKRLAPDANTQNIRSDFNSRLNLGFAPTLKNFPVLNQYSSPIGPENSNPSLNYNYNKQKIQSEKTNSDYQFADSYRTANNLNSSLGRNRYLQSINQGQGSSTSFSPLMYPTSGSTPATTYSRPASSAPGVYPTGPLTPSSPNDIALYQRPYIPSGAGSVSGNTLQSNFRPIDSNDALRYLSNGPPPRKTNDFSGISGSESNSILSGIASGRILEKGYSEISDELRKQVAAYTKQEKLLNNSISTEEALNKAKKRVLDQISKQANEQFKTGETKFSEVKKSFKLPNFKSQGEDRLAGGYLSKSGLKTFGAVTAGAAAAFVASPSSEGFFTTIAGGNKAGGKAARETTLAGVSGGIGGAALGLGPLGAIAVGAGTALVTLSGAAQRAAKEVADADFEESFKKLGTALESGVGIIDAQKELAGKRAASEKAVNDTVYNPSIGKQFSFALSHAQDALSSSTSVSGFFKKLTNPGEDFTNKVIKQQEDERKKSIIEINRPLATTLNKEAESTIKSGKVRSLSELEAKFPLLVSSISRATDGTDNNVKAIRDEFATRIKATIRLRDETLSLAGGLSSLIGTVDQTTKKFADFEINPLLGVNTGATDFIKKFENINQGSLGSDRFARDVTQANVIPQEARDKLLGVNKLASVLPSILDSSELRLANNTGNLSAELGRQLRNSRVSEEVVQQVENTLQNSDFFKDSGKVQEALNSDPRKVVRALTEAFDPLINSTNELVKEQERYKTGITNQFGNFVASRNSLIDSRSNAINARVNVGRTASRFLGLGTTSGIDNANITNAVRAQTGFGDVGNLSKLLSTFQDNLAKTGDPRYKIAIDNVRHGLEKLADSTGRTRDIMEKIGELETSRNAKIGFTEKVITGSPKDARELLFKANFAKAFVSSNADFEKSNPKVQAAVIEGLRAFGDAIIPGKGKSGNKIADEILGKASGATEVDQIKQLQQQVISITQEEALARKALYESEKLFFDRMFQALAPQNQQFAQGLNRTVENIRNPLPPLRNQNPISPENINSNFNNQFGVNIDKLSAVAAAIPHSIDMNGSHTVEVVHNGAEVFKEMDPFIRGVVQKQINKALNKFIKDKLPDTSPFDLDVGKESQRVQNEGI